MSELKIRVCPCYETITLTFKNKLCVTLWVMLYARKSGIREPLLVQIAIIPLTKLSYENLYQLRICSYITYFRNKDAQQHLFQQTVQ